MPNRRHAEIAGAGIAGLTAAAALALRGWTVRVHERAPELRDIGIGTSVWANGHHSLAAIGALDEVLQAGTRIVRIEVRDNRERPLRTDSLAGEARGLVILRADLHRALVNAARRAGAEIVTASGVMAADPSGALMTEDGKCHAGDLVIGADGYGSKVRDSLGVADEVGFVTNATIGRTIVPRHDPNEPGTIREYWAGTRCCGVLSCGDFNYMFLSAPEDCLHNPEEVRTNSIVADAWSAEFPFLDSLFRQIKGNVIWGRYPIVRCHTWSVGRAALIGDAAHAMPSTLAQGAGCAMANALAMVEAVTGAPDIRAALVGWETNERPITEITQRWAVLYLTLLKRWPSNLIDMRVELITEAFSSSGILEHFTTAARHRVKFTSPAMAAVASVKAH
jgi:2-polyprenyl-6-methoxyphenol hydroxylase-like FAD-dependent oxidoreductase